MVAKKTQPRRTALTWAVIGATVLVFVAATILTLLVGSKTKRTDAYAPSVLGHFSNAAVAVDGTPCAQIAKDVLLEGGRAMDAALAALFCNGVYSAQSMGLGGGFLLTHFDAKSGLVEALDAREAAPRASHEEMFQGDAESARYGARSVAVPGEAAGYWEAKKRYGNPDISWARLVAPTVKMCREGIPVSWTQASVLELVHTRGEWARHANAEMNATFHNKDGQPWKEGDVYTRPKYADTLEELAEAGDRGEKNLGFYEGRVAEDMVADLQELGGVITLDDLGDYEARWVKPVQVSLESLNSTFYSVPPPGSGAILAYILNMLDLYKIKPKDDNPLLFHRIVETFKWAYALRTELGDGAGEEAIRDTINHLVSNLTSEEWAKDRFEQIQDDSTVNDAKHYGAVFYTPEDHGTAHVSVIAANGDAVSVTSTVNLYFGSLIMSPSTGILLNDEMDDFSAPNITNYFGVPPSPHNFIRPGKRPLSSMCPSLLIDKNTNQVRLAIGAAGGTKITTAVAQAIIRNQWLGEDIKSAIDARRLHHQLAPMVVSYEPGTSKEVLESLEAQGHTVSLVDKFGSVVVGIERMDNKDLYANVDFRKAGAVDGY